MSSVTTRIFHLQLNSRLWRIFSAVICEGVSLEISFTSSHILALRVRPKTHKVDVLMAAYLQVAALRFRLFVAGNSLGRMMGVRTVWQFSCGHSEASQHR